MRYRTWTIFAAIVGIAALAACGPVKKSPPAPPVTVTYSTVGTHSFVVPAGVTLIGVDAYGAEGGPGADNMFCNPEFGVGGKGGRATTTLAVTPGETLQINVGGAGNDGDDGGEGGSNGGGTGGSVEPDGRGGGGGGASD